MLAHTLAGHVSQHQWVTYDKVLTEETIACVPNDYRSSNKKPEGDPGISCNRHVVVLKDEVSVHIVTKCGTISVFKKF